MDNNSAMRGCQDKPPKRQRCNSTSDTPETESERLGESSAQLVGSSSIQTTSARGIFDSSRINTITGGRFTQTSRDHANVVVHFHQHSSGSSVDVTEHLNQSRPISSSSEAQGSKTKRPRKRSRRNPTFPQSFSSGFIPVIRPNQIYENHLLTKGRGYPLWIPECSLTLPRNKQKVGICVGDVGLITSAGAFSFLFNITLPIDHEFHPTLMPEGFQPIEVSRRGNTLTSREFKQRSSLTSVSIRELDLESNASIWEQVFESSSTDGAILTLPEGAVSDETEGIGFWRKYMADNVESWYIYVNGTLGREAENGDIRLVVGCDKTSAWGMVAAGKQVISSQPYQLRFREVNAQNSLVKHLWDCNGVVDARAGPSRDELQQLAGESGVVPRDHLCVFVRTLNAMVSEEAWAKIHHQVQVALGNVSATSDNTPSGSSSNEASSTDVATRGGSSEYENIASWTGTRSYANNNLDSNHRMYTDAHPADIINRFLLYQQPGAKVAVTCDDDWRFLLEEEEGNPDAVLDDDELISVVLLNRIIQQDGPSVYLTDSSQQSFHGISSPDWPNLEELKANAHLPHLQDDTTTSRPLTDIVKLPLPTRLANSTSNKSAELDAVVPLLRALTAFQYNVKNHNRIQQHLCPPPDLEIYKDFSPENSRVVQRVLGALNDALLPHLQANPALLSQFKNDEDKISFAQTLLKRLLSPDSSKMEDLATSISNLSLDEVVHNRIGSGRQMHHTCKVEPESTDHMLIVYISGFKGDTQIFDNFSQRVEHLLQAVLPHVKTEMAVYPASQMKDNLDAAILHFVDWLVALIIKREVSNGTDARTVKVALCGHSTGGILAADALRELHRIRSTNDSPSWPHVVACIALDTPYFGVHPNVIHSEELSDSTSSSRVLAGAATAAIAGPVVASGIVHSSVLVSGTIAGSVELGISTGLALASGLIGGLASLALLTAGGLAAYQQNRLRTRQLSSVTDWMRYFDQIGDQALQKERFDALLKIEKEHGVLFRLIYTQLPPASPASLACRTFIVVPHGGNEDSRNLVPLANTAAGNELQAHIRMLSSSTNSGYFRLTHMFIKVIEEALKMGKERVSG